MEMVAVCCAVIKKSSAAHDYLFCKTPIDASLPEVEESIEAPSNP